MSVDSELFIRLYLDEDVHKDVATALRLRQFDAISVHEQGRQGLSDEDQLTDAAKEGRTILTFNTSDYVQLHIQWVKAGKDHSGIIVSEQLPVGETVRRLLKLLNRISADEMQTQIRWLQAFK